MKLSDTLLRQDGLSMARDGTTYCGTRGEYKFLLLTAGNELIVSVLRSGENPEKDDFRDFVKARPELSGCKTAGTRVTFSLRPGATAKSCAEKIHTLLPELLLFLHENGYENCCEISRAVGATVGCMTGGVPRLVAPALFTELSRKAEQNERVQAEAPEDISRGILGALIGGLIGAAAIVLIGQLGYVAAIYQGEIIGTVPLETAGSAERSGFVSRLLSIRNLTGSRRVRAGVIFFLVCLTAWIVTETLIRRRRKNRWNQYFSSRSKWR